MGEKIPRLAGLIDIVAWLYTLREKTMMDLIDWVEKAGLENLRFHLQSADNLTKESNTTLTILLTGAGGALAYALKSVEASSPGATTYAAMALSLYLFVLCGLLVLKCIWIGIIPALTNEPDNLFQPSFGLEQLRKVELKNIQVRIKQVIARNNTTADWLNRVRTAAIIGTPFIGGVFFLFARSRLYG